MSRSVDERLTDILGRISAIGVAEGLLRGTAAGVAGSAARSTTERHRVGRALGSVELDPAAAVLGSEGVVALEDVDLGAWGSSDEVPVEDVTVAVEVGP